MAEPCRPTTTRRGAAPGHASPARSKRQALAARLMAVDHANDLAERRVLVKSPDSCPLGSGQCSRRTTGCSASGSARRGKKDRYRALREVRHTILRLIGDHYRISQATHRSWQGCNLDLTGVTIDTDMDFSGAVFSGSLVTFTHAVFSGGTVGFSGTVGPAPLGLIEAVGNPVPAEVHLPSDWLSHPIGTGRRKRSRAGLQNSRRARSLRGPLPGGRHGRASLPGPPRPPSAKTARHNHRTRPSHPHPARACWTPVGSDLPQLRPAVAFSDPEPADVSRCRPPSRLRRMNCPSCYHRYECSRR